MDTFAFIIHPIDPKQDVSRKFPLLGKVLTEKQIHFFSTFFPPVYISEITGIRSESTGKEVKGWFVACPYTPQRMLTLKEQTVYNKVIQTGRMAEKLGAKLLGLGAFTSVIGDSGITIAKNLAIPVTTGDSYTIATAVRSIEQAAQQMNIPLETASAAVVGATGAIGRTCASLLAHKVNKLYLIGRSDSRLDDAAKHIKAEGGTAELVSTTEVGAIRHAKLILTVTSNAAAFIEPNHLQPGSVICDVARPRDVSKKVAEQRKDVLVFDGGVVDVPGPVNFNFNFGFPPGKSYACMAETIALALEGRFENYTLGKQISRQQVEEIDTIATKHGFKLSGFRCFEKTLTQNQIKETRLRAQAAQQLP
jgi:predicted amino acid dehydrogenase